MSIRFYSGEKVRMMSKRISFLLKTRRVSILLDDTEHIETQEGVIGYEIHINNTIIL